MFNSYTKHLPLETDIKQLIETFGGIFSDEEPMEEYFATVRLMDNNAAVRLGQEDIIVSPREGIGAGGDCPIAYVVTALGS